ncbi:MAG: hypothetical protein ACRDQ7_18040 [Haloechinothrix sp.]
MKAITRAVLGGLGAAALGSMVVAGPAAASSPAGGELNCTYRLNQQAGKVSGSCAGSTDFGSASGSFTGHLRPGGFGSGEFTVDGPAGSYSGSFKGKPFKGGKAKGSWSVELGSLSVSGTFVAISR